MSYVDKIENLCKVLKPVSDRQDADAAVALLLKLPDQDLKILIVKRAENPADPWSGQMAFPGGKRDEKDQNLKQKSHKNGKKYIKCKRTVCLKDL